MIRVYVLPVGEVGFPRDHDASDREQIEPPNGYDVADDRLRPVVRSHGRIRDPLPGEEPIL